MSMRMNRRLERVNVASLRVALVATGAFAIVYAIVAALIVVLVTNNLQSQIDDRLTSEVTAVQAGRPPIPRDFQLPTGDPNAVTMLAWAVTPDGLIVYSTMRNWSMPLPAAAITANQPTTTAIGRGTWRVDSVAVEGGRVVFGVPFGSVAQTRDTISFTELLVGIVLLGVAFVGALYGGRRVGAPIEIARQRQMEFTADASHELRTPLSVIEAQTSLALSHDRDPAWYRSAFVRVGHESKRIRGLVEDLLWLARVDSSPAEEHSEPVEVGVLAAQAVDRFAAVAEARGIRLRLSVGRGSHMVNGSAEWLDRLLGVLVDNACKYAPDQGDVRVSVINDGNRVRTVVEDSGPGIPHEERSRIFERFHRATSEKPGAGLGLSIADAVVRRTHGRWEIGASDDLGGAIVGVSWPRTGSGSREPVRAEAVESTAQSPPQGSPPAASPGTPQAPPGPAAAPSPPPA